MTVRNRTLALTALASVSLVLAALPAQASPAPVRKVGITSMDGSGGAYAYPAPALPVDGTTLPIGARIVVQAVYTSDGKTMVTLHLMGAEPLREYGAHAHKAACTAVSTDALGHFQNVPNPDPLNPTDPTYANPTNEIWLDVETNWAGNGSAQTVVPWQPGTARPMSVVIHAAHTGTEQGTAGTAGARLGCMTVPF